MPLDADDLAAIREAVRQEVAARLPRGFVKRTYDFMDNSVAAWRLGLTSLAIVIAFVLGHFSPILWNPTGWVKSTATEATVQVPKTPDPTPAEQNLKKAEEAVQKINKPLAKEGGK